MLHARVCAALSTQCECAPDAARRPVERERLHHADTSWPPCAVCTYPLSRLYAARAWRWRGPLASPPARRGAGAKPTLGRKTRTSGGKA